MLRSGCSCEEDGLRVAWRSGGRRARGGASGGRRVRRRRGRACCAGPRADAAEHVFKELVREHEIDGAAFRAQGVEVRGTLALAP